MPIHGSSLQEIDMRRIEDYFLNILDEGEVKTGNKSYLIVNCWSQTNGRKIFTIVLMPVTCCLQKNRGDACPKRESAC